MRFLSSKADFVDYAISYRCNVGILISEDSEALGGKDLNLHRLCH